MPNMGKTSSYTGRANTVLVFGHGNSAKAVITTVVAHVRDKESGERVRFVGPAIFEGKTAKHIVEVVLAAADSILKGLNLPEKYFDISVVNLDASAIMDVGLEHLRVFGGRSYTYWQFCQPAFKWLYLKISSRPVT